MEQGWIKFYREWMSNIAITKDNDHLAVWIYLLTNTTYTEKEDYFNAKKITLKAGQLLCMQKDICNNLKLEPTKLRRILKLFKSAELIDYQTDNHKTLITLVVWDFSQSSFAEQNADLMPNQCRSKQETENEKEKRSKREKDKEKEKNKNEKNERSVCVGAHTYGHTQKDLLFLGRYENVVVSQEFYEEFKEKYWYYDKVIDKLSAYKKARNIVNNDDIPYLEQFAIEDKDKYIKPGSSFDTFDADEFFEAALKRSYAKDDDEW